MDRHIPLVSAALLFAFVTAQPSTDNQQTIGICEPYDFKWEYTECDKSGKRWRVQVPKTHGACITAGSTPKTPMEAHDCDYTCNAGQYLDVQADEQTCKSCEPGTYSLGGGIRYEDWDTIPDGFKVESHEFPMSDRLDRHPEFAQFENNSCEYSQWQPQGSSISAHPSMCVVSLVHTVTLVKPGQLRFSYKLNDYALLKVDILNSDCQSSADSKSGEYLKQAKDDDWSEYEIELESGSNTIYWKTFGLGAQETFQQPVRIKNIEIHGIAFTQECTPCPAGTYSDKGATACAQCPVNTYSDKRSAQCTKCEEKTHYAPMASSACLQRPLCTEKDFFEYNDPCKDGKTKKMYSWVDPKVCRDDIAGAVTLPPSGLPEDCPPCNPGQEVSERGCRFCAADQYSNGLAACQQCPGSTTPVKGLYLQWWHDLPFAANVSTECASNFEAGCTSNVGWVTSTTYQGTSTQQSDDAFLILRIHVGGFKGQAQDISGRLTTVATVQFVFEVNCTEDCTFFFLREKEGKAIVGIEEWIGTIKKTDYSYSITDTSAVSFLWVFRKQSIKIDKTVATFTQTDDWAKIYSINITNTLGGGADTCRVCPKGAASDGCIPCGPGQYIDPASLQCKTCPPGTIESSGTAWGKESCLSCGSGLTPRVEGSTGMCVTTCMYHDEQKGFQYDLRTLSSALQVQSTPMFDSRGQGYYHHFNMSLCGGSPGFNLSTCIDNITTRTPDDMTVQSIICRSNVLHNRGSAERTLFSSQPMSIADTIVSISTTNTYEEILNQTGFSPAKDEGYIDHDLYFYYRGNERTKTCKNGRSTLVVLRCDLGAKQPEVSLPPKCPFATCDGCTYIIMVRAAGACPVCTDTSAEAIKQQCIMGQQKITYIMPKYCGSDPPPPRYETCQPLPFWLEITLMAGGVLGIIMCGVLVYCWKTNRKLEYKYMKLVGSSSDNQDDDSKLPTAETCALDEDEEEDHFDAVEFTSHGRTFMSRIKSLATRKAENPFQEFTIDDREGLVS